MPELRQAARLGEDIIGRAANSANNRRYVVKTFFRSCAQPPISGDLSAVPLDLTRSEPRRLRDGSIFVRACLRPPHQRCW